MARIMSDLAWAAGADEGARVIGWRAFELVEAGYPAEDALKLAESPEVDLHTACELLLKGCTVELAVRILL
jgi:hypothetical protein